jgi:16S rRNA (guanine527-N7)-methyltransferase
LATLIATSPHNLVSRKERERVREVHVAEALAVGDVLGKPGDQRWLDLGTGGGLPGLALAICWPDVRWTLLDATAKKIEAVAEFARELGLARVTALSGRAEELAHDPHHREQYDAVIARAVAPLPVLVELARGFLRRGGVLHAVKGPAWREELDAAAGAMRRLGLEFSTAADVPDAVRPTTVVTMRAAKPVVALYPRRSGLPRAQPPGAGSPGAGVSTTTYRWEA